MLPHLPGVPHLHVNRPLLVLVPLLLQEPEKELIDEGPPPASQIPVVKNAIKIKLK